MEHVLKWHTASPLWGLTLQDGGVAPVRFEQPQILRFASDDFMDKLQATVAGDPERISELAVRHETWQTPLLDQVGWQTPAAQNAEEPPKLYQPAHNRYYLVGAQLICQQRGLPDRAIDVPNRERAGLLVRRLLAKPGQTLNPKQPSTYDEYGWFGDRQRGSWLKIGQPDGEAPLGEERLAMFPLTFDAGGRKRRLLAGMVPVASREVYEGGAEKAPVESIASEPASDPRFARFSGEVGSALVNLRDMEAMVSNSSAQDGLLFALISFGGFLAAELPEVWTDINNGPAATGTRATLVARLRNTAHGISRTVSGMPHTFTWAEMLVNANGAALKAQFLAGARPAGLIPIGFNFSRNEIDNAASSIYPENPPGPIIGEVKAALGDPRGDELADLLAARFAPLATPPASWGDAAAREALLAALLELSAYLSRELPEVWAAVEAGSPVGLNASRLAVYNFLQARSIHGATWRAALADTEANRTKITSGQFPRAILLVKLGATKAEVDAFATEITAGSFLNSINSALAADPITPQPAPSQPTPDSYYVIRCVYDRPACPIAKPVISRATRPFRLASLFDPDAPIRPLKIRMPVDTSFDGLSKFPKGVSFVLSDELRKQMARAEQVGMQGLLDGNEGSGSFDLGVICSFSIPIITICALILLMIIVQLLNIVFWWLPLFRICLPVPVKAK